MMKQVLQAKSSLKKNSRDFDQSVRRSRTAFTHTPLETIPAMTEVKVQDLVPFKGKRCEPLRACTCRGIVVLWNAVSSMAPSREEFGFATEPIV